MLIGEMEEKGISPNLVTYTSLIDGNIKIGRVDHAFDLIGKMMNDGCMPNQQTYCKLIDGLVKENNVQQTQAISYEDELATSKHDGSVKIQAMDNMWKIMKVDIALHLLDRMMQKYCQPTIDTYSALIAGFSKADRMLKASQLIKIMLERGHSPHESIYTTLVDGYCKQEKYMDSLELLDKMTKNS